MSNYHNKRLFYFAVSNELEKTYEHLLDQENILYQLKSDLMSYYKETGDRINKNLFLVIMNPVLSNIFFVISRSEVYLETIGFEINKLSDLDDDDKKLICYLSEIKSTMSEAYKALKIESHEMRIMINKPKKIITRKMIYIWISNCIRKVHKIKYLVYCTCNVIDRKKQEYRSEDFKATWAKMTPEEKERIERATKASVSCGALWEYEE